MSGEVGAFQFLEIGGALQFFRHLKMALVLLSSVRMSPLATFWDHRVDTITHREKEEEEKKNKHAPVISLMRKKKKNN